MTVYTKEWRESELPLPFSRTASTGQHDPLHWLGPTREADCIAWVGIPKCSEKINPEKFDVDFSFCWLILEGSWFSLEQNSCCSCRWAFIYFSRIYQVWTGSEKTVLVWKSNRLTEHAQSLLGGVKQENPKGKGKLRNEIIKLIKN